MREFGIRRALGAQASAVLAQVLGHGLRLAAVGILLGLLAALAGTRIIASWLFGVAATDLPTYAVVTVGLALITVLASWLPARRAMRVDPAVTLRAE